MEWGALCPPLHYFYTFSPYGALFSEHEPEAVYFAQGTDDCTKDIIMNACD